MYDCIALLSPPLHMKVLNDLMTTSCTLFYSQLTRGKKVLKTKLQQPTKCQLAYGVEWKFPLGARSFYFYFLCKAYSMKWGIAELRESAKKD